MARDRGDTRAFLFAAGTLVVAGLVVAALMLAVTRGNGTPSVQDNGPLDIGDNQSIIDQIDEGGPLYFANPFGGDGFWVATDGDQLVAYVLQVPGRENCNIKWQGRDNTFVDCDRNPVDTAGLEHYSIEVKKKDSADRGQAYVDLTRIESASPSTASPST